MFKWFLIGCVLVSAVSLSASNALLHQPASGGSTRAACAASPRVAGQGIEEVAVDVSRSTNDLQLRGEYAQASSLTADDAVNRGAYFRLSVFGSSIVDGETICETSTRTKGAAPLFATAQLTALQKELDKAVQATGVAQAAVSGSDIYGALVRSIQQVQALRDSEPVFARVVLLTDGGHVAGDVRLRRALKVASDVATAQRIIGQQSPPDARGISVEIRGVGRTRARRPLSTSSVQRIVHIWELICAATRAKSCQVTPDLS